MKNTLSVSQAGMLCTITLLANKTSMLPSLLYEGTKSDGFFVVLLLFAFELLVLGTFIMLKYKFPDMSLSEILENHIGKFFTKCVFIAFMLFFLFKVLLAYGVGYVYLKQQVYQGEYTVFALVCFLPVINHAVIKGLRAFSRTIELFYYVLCGGIVLCLAVSLMGFHTIPIFFTSTFEQFFSTGFNHIIAFGDYLFLFLIIDRIELKKGEAKKMLKFVFIGIILTLAIMFIFFSLYGITAFMHSNALADITVSSIQFSAIGRLDVFAMVTRMFLTFFELEIFHFSFSEAFCNTFKKLSRPYSIVTFDIIFALVYFIVLGKFEKIIIYTVRYLPYFAIITNFLIPLMLFFIALPKKKEVKYEKSF